VRYRFRALERDTGKPVEGHVEAGNPEEALGLLSENGYVTESLREDPKPLNLSSQPFARPEVADAIDSALDTASSQVAFDALADRFRGKNVWVIDRDKIRRRVSQVVDQVMAQTMANTDADLETRRKVAEAIEGLFKDTQNITSRAPQVAAAGSGELNATLEKQIGRLANFITKAESLLASMSSTLRNISVGGGGYAPRRARVSGGQRDEQNAVLAEIFKSNVELLSKLEGKGIVTEDASTGEAVQAADAATATAILEPPPESQPASESFEAPAGGNSDQTVGE